MALWAKAKQTNRRFWGEIWCKASKAVIWKFRSKYIPTYVEMHFIATSSQSSIIEQCVKNAKIESETKQRVPRHEWCSSLFVGFECLSSFCFYVLCVYTHTYMYVCAFVSFQETNRQHSISTQFIHTHTHSHAHMMQLNTNAKKDTRNTMFEGFVFQKSIH